MKLSVKNIKHKSLTSKTRLYNLDLPIIAITGGIGTGKTQASSFFKSIGKKVICADSLVKNIYKTEDAKKLIRTMAPTAIENEIINFPELRNIFFNNEQIKNDIEKFIYSNLEQFFKNEISSKDKIIFYDVPLLFENNLEDKVDFSLLIHSDEQTQIERIVSRDNIDNVAAKKILSHQIPINNKIQLSDYVIYNNKSIKNLKNELQIFVDEIALCH